MNAYFDASALVSLWREDVHYAALTAWIVHSMPRPIISDFARAEFISALSLQVRSNQLKDEDANELVVFFDEWTAGTRRVRLSSRDVDVAAEYLMQFTLGLRAPDALHIAACQRFSATLVTFDKRQWEGAKRLGVPVVDFDASS